MKFHLNLHLTANVAGVFLCFLRQKKLWTDLWAVRVEIWGTKSKKVPRSSATEQFFPKKNAFA